MSRNYTRKTKKKVRYTPKEWPVRGLKLIHIGDDIWRIGGEKNGHQVIYGPDRKEYHLGEKEISLVRGEILYTQRNRNNTADQARVKIYILTSILDKRENWCFDLSKIPEIGKLKVIYSNGTVKNIEFGGEFKDEELKSKSHHPFGIYTGESWQQKYHPKKKKLQGGNVFEMKDQPMVKYYIKPVAYRIS